VPVRTKQALKALATGLPGKDAAIPAKQPALLSRRRREHTLTMNGTSLSPLKPIEQADPVVQAVMILLAIASIACWTIGIEKLLRFIAISRHLRSFEDVAAGCSKGRTDRTAEAGRLSMPIEDRVFWPPAAIRPGERHFTRVSSIFRGPCTSLRRGPMVAQEVVRSCPVIVHFNEKRETT
jgi:hypothetical protein